MPPARDILRWSLRVLLELALVLLVIGLLAAIWLPAILGGTGA